MTRHCPLCGLNFRHLTELELHARDDHRPPAAAERRETITRYPADKSRFARTYAPSM